ncbi:unnamed protein product [Heterobilharzia americana]|nr:unnamed protein product [Heterobilharzia americana]CAH8617755.1 unnamed protein product [Heterobilharzia americana]
MALSYRAESVLLNWIPVNSRLFVARLKVSVRTRKNYETNRYLSLIFAYAPTDRTSDGVNDEFYELSILLQKPKRSDTVTMAVNINARVRKLNQSERRLWGIHGIPLQ